MEFGVVLKAAVGVTVRFDALEELFLRVGAFESAVTLDADEGRKAIFLSKVVFVVGGRFYA